MTRQSSTKSADANYAAGRFRTAHAFHRAALLVMSRYQPGADADVVESNASIAAVAYCDSITAALGGRVNQKDHAMAPKLLRDTLGNALPREQERRLARLLGRKDEAQYGARVGRRDDAESALRDLEKFARWAAEVLQERGFDFASLDLESWRPPS